jgi:hypothetical protein
VFTVKRRFVAVVASAALLATGLTPAAAAGPLGSVPNGDCDRSGVLDVTRTGLPQSARDHRGRGDNRANTGCSHWAV